MCKSNYKSASRLIDQAETLYALRKMSDRLTRYYEAGVITDKELMRLDIRLCDRMNSWNDLAFVIDKGVLI